MVRMLLLELISSESLMSWFFRHVYNKKLTRWSLKTLPILIWKPQLCNSVTKILATQLFIASVCLVGNLQRAIWSMKVASLFTICRTKDFFKKITYKADFFLLNWFEFYFIQFYEIIQKYLFNRENWQLLIIMHGLPQNCHF